MIHLERLLLDVLVAALFELASRPAGLAKAQARASLAAHDAGPIGRALRHADASRAAPAKCAAQS